MATVIVRHKVGDFDTWISGHQERADLFASVVSSFKTFQDVDDPNSIVGWITIKKTTMCSCNPSWGESLK